MGEIPMADMHDDPEGFGKLHALEALLAQLLARSPDLDAISTAWSAHHDAMTEMVTSKGTAEMLTEVGWPMLTAAGEFAEGVLIHAREVRQRLSGS